MNKAITDGLQLMPPSFQGGLDVWSSEDGTPGSTTYDMLGTAAAVSGDGDFASCLEVLKTDAIQKLRWTGETPILPGCYLRISARVKAISGALPSVRIAAWVGDSAYAHVASVAQTGPETAIGGYGEVVEVSAIVGAGARTGVDMVWGGSSIYAHVGLDLTGATGGILRIEDIRVEDVTNVFHRSMMDWVDVRDFGAIGDGVADDTAAFLAADAAANGRSVLVPEGSYALTSDVTMLSPVRFVGTVAMDDPHSLILRRNFDLPSYAAAFGDEVTGLRKGLRALLDFSDHESFDLGGRRIEVDAPIDMADAVGETTYEIRRVVPNGQFNVVPGAAWDAGVVTSAASYDAGAPETLSAVADIANIEVGSLVTGSGVGREVHVTAKNVGAGSLTLSQPLFGASGTQTYTFTRHRYVLDFSGFTKLSKFTLTDVEIHCQGEASGILLAPLGETFHLKDCFVTKPRHRGVTSHGRGCQDLQIDRCHFASDEQSVAATSRISVALNVNANDAKIRDSRFARFGTTMVLHGNGHLIVGNHWYQGDTVADGPRTAGLVLTEPNVKSVLTGNYIDNCFIEWTNEHDAAPGFSSEYSFGGLAVTGNVFTVNDAASWFNWIVIKPFGPGHFVHGLSMTGNSFKSLNGQTDRIDGVDDSIAPLDPASFRNIVVDGNTFNGVGTATQNPVVIEVEQASEQAVWTMSAAPWLPFGAAAKRVVAAIADDAVTNAAGDGVFAAPRAGRSVTSDVFTLTWPEPVKGRVQVTVRGDTPV